MQGRVNKRFWLIILSSLFLSPTLVYADVGTPLIWLTTGHLYMGNAIIGIFEGLIIAKVFKNKYSRSILIMILANYISMIVGKFGIDFSSAALKNIASINNASYIIWGLLFGSYALTVIIEWPFCFWIMKGKEDRKKRSFKASILLQSASYAILIPIYLSVSGITLITKTTVDKPTSFIKVKDAWVYFISTTDGDIYKVNADGNNKQEAKKAGIANPYVTLFVSNNNGKVNLNAYWWEGEGRNFKNITKLLLEDIPGETAVAENSSTIGLWEKVVDFRLPSERGWDIETSIEGVQGLKGENKTTGKSFWIALGTPFLSWPILKASILPGDQVICQLGDNQIVLIDLNTRHIGLITFGRGPVVVLEK